MIYLGASRTNIPSIAGIWKDNLHSFLFDVRKKSVPVKDGRKTISSHKTYHDMMEGQVDYRYKRRKIKAKDRDWVKRLLRYFKTHFDEIILADENEMTNIIAYYLTEIKSQKKSVQNIFGKLMTDLYDAFRKYKDLKLGISYSHKFFNMLDIRTCPYCNRQYTFTLDEKNAKTAPEYDHFYDKADYPILAVSFYNLIPSCHTCNHIKGRKKTVKLNPYFAGFESNFVLLDNMGSTMNKAEILKQGGGKLALKKSDGTDSVVDNGNIETFGLKGLYDLHEDYVSDIVEKVVAYDSTVQQALANAFQGPAYHPQMVYDFVWGKYLGESQFEKRPLSKLTRDILEQMGIKNKK
jgi:hypothetical protein